MAAMSFLGAALDIALAVQLLAFAWLTLAAPNLFQAIVLFVAFGFLMALAWVRLEAPDIALAEAAIGAGLTGALLLSALPRLPSGDASSTGYRRSTSLFRLLPAALLIAVAAGLGYSARSLPEAGRNLRAPVMAHLGASGVSNPVTAVLLNFRGYDTLLEMTVLLLALLATWSLRQPPLERKMPPGSVLTTMSRTLAPVLILVVGYLLWSGSHAPGGAFQAGAVLGAAGVLLILGEWRLPEILTGTPVRMALTIGTGTFLFVALITTFVQGEMLQYPPALAGTLILIVEAAASVSIGATLAALFLGGPPDSGDGK